MPAPVTHPDWQAPAYQQWRLAVRKHLNPGSAGAATFHLELEAIGAVANWEAGDLCKYSRQPIQNVRVNIRSRLFHPMSRAFVGTQERREDGSLGIASGCLTEQAAVGETITLRLRPHNNFRLGDNAHRPLILIGNGTGLAGLRSH